MKKCYIVIYENFDNNQSTVSSECYFDVEDARKFIMSRSNEYKEINPMTFADSNSMMKIKEISLKGEIEND